MEDRSVGAFMGLSVAWEVSAVEIFHSLPTPPNWIESVNATEHLLIIDSCWCDLCSRRRSSGMEGHAGWRRNADVRWLELHRL